MANTIIMSKYQGLGNDYLILDPKKNQVQLQGKKIALLCQRGFGLGADGVQSSFPEAVPDFSSDQESDNRFQVPDIYS